MGQWFFGISDLFVASDKISFVTNCHLANCQPKVPDISADDVERLPILHLLSGPGSLSVKGDRQAFIEQGLHPVDEAFVKGIWLDQGKKVGEPEISGQLFDAQFFF